MTSQTALLMLLATVGGASAQVYSVGGCPQYQTSSKFTADRIKTMVSQGGMMPFLASGTLGERDHTCQYLELQEGNKFTYTYRDGLGSQHTVTGDFDAVSSTFKDPGYLRLSMGRLGLLGSDVTGNVRLYPVMMEGETQVYVACTNFGFFHAEYAYAFVNARSRSSVSLGDMKNSLIQRGLPLSDSMTVKDQTCFDYDVVMSQRVPASTSSNAIASSSSGGILRSGAISSSGASLLTQPLRNSLSS